MRNLVPCRECGQHSEDGTRPTAHDYDLYFDWLTRDRLLPLHDGLARSQLAVLSAFATWAEIFFLY